MDHLQYEESLSETHELPSQLQSVAPTEERACSSCRRRKLKCSRELPSCAHCLRLNTTCHYDHKKNKPGIKAGAVENLSRRVEVLEKALLHQNDTESSGATSNSADHPTITCIRDVLSFMAKELKKASEAGSLHASSPVRSYRGQNGSVDSHCSCSDGSNRPQKRQRIEVDQTRDEGLQFLEDEEDSYYLPSKTVMDAVVDTYFLVIHPWIPMLHQSRFRQRLSDANKKSNLAVILHAMTAAALPHISDNIQEMVPSGIDAAIRKSRHAVILTAMDNLSVENLQALIIIAFDNMGKGEGTKAFSIIGSLTRTVEYLQLTVESDEHERQPLLKPLTSLPATHNWTEAEERRRVFWVIFLLDRFCSVTTGWNTSLTSDDVHRRLPADGGLWAKEEAVTTPYFGIWDKSAAKIGKSIAYIPAHYPSPEQNHVSGRDTHNGSSPRGGSGSETVDISTIGAFAYCIEATESLSQVTTFFLQQKVDFQDRQEVSSWLTRFKELDLRLVHWKMFLPQKWKDSNISREPAFINMDPNLTLAHITHNTSMILLHQRIAYPPRDWSEIVKLPSFCSAETCQLAAVETADISKKYLKYTPPSGIVPSQFTFCVFVSARVLLVHWRYYDAKLLPEFWILVDCLQEMSMRWCGHPREQEGKVADQALKYSQQLRDLYGRCITDRQFLVDALGYSSEPGALGPSEGGKSSATEDNEHPHGRRESNRNEPSAHHPPVSPNSIQANLTSPNIARNAHPILTDRQVYDPAHQEPVLPNMPVGCYSSEPSSSNQTPPNPTANHESTSSILTYNRPPSTSSPVVPCAPANNQQLQYNSFSRTHLHSHLPQQDNLQQQNGHHQVSASTISPNPISSSEDELSLISHALLGQQFLEMDRVISFDDTTFALSGAVGGAVSGDLGVNEWAGLGVQRARS
ncbi:hypothetical protein AJ79_01060 [Helicocarpus griseus UAMH5409]|uniref:Zn(2)-C6 fungal-type domain-containing protein n=1 Tax=Helicocarpus griseus UAMH5409 TaxID=1447875 RepID=A0A2B7Y8D6_9EURO|nr:hypothetical protein AJ79_01060 [Helicocarpus griseus UAMH5409]